MTRDVGGADLLRGIGLLADGPVRWGRPVTARGPGVYLVELPAPLATAPIDLAKVGRWLERVPAIRLDGVEPSSKALAARLAAFWLPDAVVLYAGGSTMSVGARIGSLTRHVLGDRRPHSDGHWLQALHRLDDLRIWWATTDAPEEALDAILDEFGSRQAALPPTRPAGALTLPWANGRRPTGERQPHGITGSLVPEEPERPAPPRRLVELPPGEADGAATEAKGSGGTVRRSTAPARPPAPAGVPARRPAPTIRRAATTKPAKPRVTRPSGAGTRFEPKREPIPLTAAAFERAQTELDELTRVRRPEVVARIKAARELGDLRENAEYHAAREEQSFLEGRVRLLEDRLQHAAIIEEGPTGRVVLGSIVTVEHAGEEMTYTIVGTTEADPAAGRISTASPVGAALLGRSVGDAVEVRTPRGSVRYEIRSIT